MAPLRKRMWLPIMGLGAFFTAVVVAGNVLLGVAYTAPPGQPESRGPSDYLERKVRKVRKLFERVRWRREEPESAVPQPIEFAFARLPLPVLALHGSESTKEPDPARYLHFLREPGVRWLESPPAPPTEDYFGVGRALLFDRVVGRDSNVFEARERLRDDWSRWSLSRSDGVVVDVLDGVFYMPRSLCDELADVVRWWFPPSGCYSLVQEDCGSMVSRLVQLREPERMESPFREFAYRWVERQQRQFGHDAYWITFGVEQGLEAVDSVDFAYEQRKTLWDVVRKVYLSKYIGRAEERLRHEAWRISDWKALDYFIAPPVLAAYTWYRGWERRITIAGTKLSVNVEPLAHILDTLDDGERDLVAAVGMEWEIPGIPVKLIVSAGVHNGDLEFDFVGIGTSLGEAKKAVKMVLAEVEGIDED
ncbi:MAG: hypothetical protein HYY16_03875 [Planctomycetes bacterium]|nr:hypothetical protein [Planctomycetota bacterium]